MLSISAMASGSEWYYTNLAREDYYLKGGEPPGIWWGKGAEGLGLSGIVEGNDLRALFKGYAPDGTELVQNAGRKDRQPGWDLTFSAPKPVSTLWSQGDQWVREQIQAAQFEAAKVGLTYLQEEVAATRRGSKGSEREAAQLITAIYEHGTSRELDPNLHSHALILNACRRQDGTVGTILSQPVYQHKLTAGALYRAELAAQLEERLGVRCKVDEKGIGFEIEGVSKELNKIFSKRREAIEKSLKSWGVESAAAAAAATIVTRMKKGEIPPREELFEMWRQVGKAIGFKPDKALGQVRRTMNDPLEFQRALKDALDKISESESHFTKSDLLREVSIQAQGRCLSGDFIRKQVREALEESKEIRPLAEWKGEFRYTTRSILETEKQLIKDADLLNENHKHGAKEKIIDKEIRQADRKAMRNPDPEKRHTLTEEQKEAIRHITQKGGGFRSLEGLAGTAKTSGVLLTANKIFEKAGYRVIGATTGGKAATELEAGSVIESMTIASLDLRMHPTLSYKMKHHLKQMVRAAVQKPTFKLKPFKFNKKTVLVLDEAAMISTRDLADLIAAVQKGGGMVVTAFDRKQLQAIGPGGGAAFLADRHGKAELTKIVRQKKEEDVKVVEAFAVGDAERALQSMADRGNVHIARNREEAMSKLVSDWAVKEQGRRNHALIFVGTRAEVAEANEKCQATRVRARELKGRSVKLGEHSFYNGDRVLFTDNVTKLGVNNGSLGTIVALHHFLGIVTVKLDNGNIIHPTFWQCKTLKLGYAVTTHKGQGTTVWNSYILAGGSMQSRELSYVQASRAEQSTNLYADRHEAGDKLSRLSKQMSKSQEKTLAHELITRREKEREALTIEQEQSK